MAKKELNSTLDTIVKTSGESSVEKLASKAIFIPTARQAKTKTKFWTRQPSGSLSLEVMTLSNAQSVTGDPGLKDWWGKPGFKEWFYNRDEAKEKLNYLFVKAIDTCEGILDDERANANAKVKVLELVAKLLDKFPDSNEKKYRDEDVSKMSEAELEKFLEKAALDYLTNKKGITIKQEKVIDVEKKEDS